MKNLSFALLLFILSIKLYSQELKTFAINDFTGLGVIFNDSSKVHLNNDYNFYILNLEEVELCESILESGLKSFLLNKYSCLAENYSFSKAQINKWNRQINNIDIKNKYKFYNRQYVGYKNDKGDTIVFVYLMNFRNKRKANLHFNNWKEDVYIGFGEFYENNTDSFYINLDKKIILK